MGNGRKYQGATHRAAGYQGRRPCYTKPPLDNNSQSYVPLWEKKFCSSVGSVSWRKLLEGKKYICLHDKVIQWEDSACEEAFHNAKSRFWAEINGLPCNLPLPDANMYIDDVDWDSVVDPELLKDLEKEVLLELEEEEDVATTEVTEKDLAAILMDPLRLHRPVTCTGWGDDFSNGEQQKMQDRSADGNRGTWNDGYRNKKERLVWQAKTPLLVGDMEWIARLIME